MTCWLKPENWLRTVCLSHMQNTVISSVLFRRWDFFSPYCICRGESSGRSPAVFTHRHLLDSYGLCTRRPGGTLKPRSVSLGHLRWHVHILWRKYGGAAELSARLKADLMSQFADLSGLLWHMPLQWAFNCHVWPQGPLFSKIYIDTL